MKTGFPQIIFQATVDLSVSIAWESDLQTWLQVRYLYANVGFDLESHFEYSRQ